MKTLKIAFLFITTLALAVSVHADSAHLWWDTAGQRDATCLYGEVTVLATAPAIYYSGACWVPGDPPWGYCGIQDNSATRRCTIFSIWDTSPELHPGVTEADPQVNHSRFGGEGNGAHTDMTLAWKTGETFRFIVTKQPGAAPGTTDVKYYMFDRNAGKWRHLATISSPNGTSKSVGKLGEGLSSFLENFAANDPSYDGKDRDVPRLATYRLWLGTSATDMKCLTKAGGDGIWGELNNAYFLAYGDNGKLQTVFANLDPVFGKPVFGKKGEHLPPIADQSIPVDVIGAINHPPAVPTTQK